MEKRNRRSSFRSTPIARGVGRVGRRTQRYIGDLFRVAKFAGLRPLRGGDLVEAICARCTLVRLGAHGEAHAGDMAICLAFAGLLAAPAPRMAIIGWAQAIRKSLDATDS
jgi:hypothetical protein